MYFSLCLSPSITQTCPEIWIDMEYDCFSSLNSIVYKFWEGIKKTLRGAIIKKYVKAKFWRKNFLNKDQIESCYGLIYHNKIIFTCGITPLISWLKQWFYEVSYIQHLVELIELTLETSIHIPCVTSSPQTLNSPSSNCVLILGSVFFLSGTEPVCALSLRKYSILPLDVDLLHP